MSDFNFKTTDVREILYGTAYFSVKAATEEEALAKLKENPWEFHTGFNERDGGIDFDCADPSFERTM